jgi:hypothetical protein
MWLGTATEVSPSFYAFFLGCTGAVDGVGKSNVGGVFPSCHLAAVPFRNTRLFEPLRKGLEAVDSLLLRVPGLKWQAWMVVFVLSEPRKTRTC